MHEENSRSNRGVAGRFLCTGQMPGRSRRSEAPAPGSGLKRTEPDFRITSRGELTPMLRRPMEMLQSISSQVVRCRAQQLVECESGLMASRSRSFSKEYFGTCRFAHADQLAQEKIDLQVSFSQDSDLVRHVPRDDEGQGAYAEGIVAGNAAPRPCLLRHMRKSEIVERRTRRNSSMELRPLSSLLAIRSRS